MKFKDDDKKSYKCEQCEFTTVGNANLKRHITGAHDGKKFECDMCEKKYSQKDRLLSHMKVHTGIGLKSCNFCDFKAENNKVLKLHLKKHEKDASSKFEKIVDKTTQDKSIDYYSKFSAFLAKSGSFSKNSGSEDFWKEGIFRDMNKKYLSNHKLVWKNFCIVSGHKQVIKPTEDMFQEYFEKEKDFGCPDELLWNKYLLLNRVVFHLYSLKVKDFRKAMPSNPELVKERNQMNV